MKLLTPALVLLYVSTASACSSFCVCEAHNNCWMPAGKHCDEICKPYSGAIDCFFLAFMNFTTDQCSRFKIKVVTSEGHAWQFGCGIFSKGNA
ncbi:hypothetical protein Ptr902_07665 [Pyrenophora tritici-repentis]|uniref:Uncharacterized protein n=1 Tax=Pyrenophora tritici-repentis TaxID=45151 RepID=A0A5M9LHK9_9PLEO|nr:hypothetical protein PtrV1_05978 [Pyrenophora tritici-repentis]KAF7450717.1 hypothetical protein A1F99_053330 [Pyrenophora tritici-repentis]KAF7573358.1 hypothetical protein PtrM4_082630 [Pyrenophora tritici-repentis]KAI0572258.1 hypothetical protein Alg130_10574 [Pyrenophora tritici-repentis]KAI0582025.1 hypothetical protein Alg215_04381 [Pyrenophora tritici-repentis]